MTTEYGIFGDEGCAEADLWSRAEAEERAAELLIEWEGDELKVDELCPSHDGRTGGGQDPQPKGACELCAEDDGVNGEGVCVSADGDEWPEHDESGSGRECRRCGAELDPAG